MSIDVIFSIAILIMSVVVHEVSHGYVAYMLGDPTAKYQGRLTLNPIPHLDPVGSVLVPLLLAVLPGNVIFGWARPVPYNPYNFSNQKWGPGLVAAAGPISNISIAVLFGLVIRFSGVLGISEAFIQASVLIVLINIVLAVFNLVPIPPLDGSKLLFTFMPYRWRHIQYFLEQYGFMVLLIFIFFFWQLIIPIVFGLFSLITGVSLGGIQ